MPDGISSKEFWAQQRQDEVNEIRLDNVEKDCAVLHNRIDQMRNRTLTVTGIFAIPIAFLLWGSYMMADDSLDQTVALKVLVDHSLDEMENMSEVQVEMREGIIEIRTGQSFLKDQMTEVRTGQKSILNELRQMNGHSSGN